MKWLYLITTIIPVLAILVPIFWPVSTIKEDRDDGDDKYFRE